MVKNNRHLLYLTFVFIGLELFDGIFRKWIIPSMSNQIMIFKDIVSIVLFVFGLRLINSNWARWAYGLALVTFVTTMLFGHGNLLVALWGAKIIFIGVPVSILLGKILTRKHLEKVLRIIIVLVPINAVLCTIQAILPASHWINRGPGGGFVKSNLLEYSAIDMAGLIRPSGIFVHTTQISLYAPLALSSIMYFLLYGEYVSKDNRMNKTFLIGCFIMYWIMIIMMVSRTAIFSSIFSLLICLFIAFKRSSTHVMRKYLFTTTVIVILTVVVFLSSRTLLRASDNMFLRFEIASEQKDNESTFRGSTMDLFNRLVTYNINAIIDPKDFKGNSPPFFGYGQGLSTQVGGKLVGNTANSGFTLAEWDALRITLESGILLGFMIIWNRLGFVLKFLTHYRASMKRRNVLPWFLYPSFFISYYFYTQWGASFQMNFAIMAAGLFITSLKINKHN